MAQNQQRTEAAIMQNQQKTDSEMQDIRNQIGQLATRMNRLESQNQGKLPSLPELNPKNVSAMTLRSGKEIQGPEPPWHGLLHWLFLSKVSTHKRLKLNHPPGPKPWPIIGNLKLLGSIPHQSLHLLSQKYGEIMQLKFGSSPVVVASSPEMAKEFLQTHDNIFASRPTTAAGKYTSYNCSDLTWAPYGPFWRQARKLYLTQIFNPKRLDSFESIRIEERRAFISSLYALSGKPIVMRDHLTRLTLSTASQMVLSNKYFAQSEGEGSLPTFEEFQEMIDTWYLLSGVFNIGDWIPWLDRFDLQGYVKQMKELHQKFDRFHNHVLDDHQAKRKTEKDFIPKDMVDILLQYAEDPDLQVKLTRDQIKGLIQVLFLLIV
ncbi:flavonoid 3'-monooxygenase-like [Coffea eugenioides]|uniref:flavonoid 3'-monooxygenase-like n=1 Tax=Coffea eugenioides TaxID=49369 RepID=UPI000F60A1AE|nr:flavonoid 3'-monooxygenase-like [Coffea eugenioides]